MNLKYQEEGMVQGGTKICQFSILLIEEDKQLAKMMHQFLRSQSYNVDSILDIMLIKKAMQQKRYDLVLLDIDFDEGAGLQLIPWLQHLQPDASFVTMTDHNFKEMEQQVRTFRFSYQLIKPFSHRELNQIIERIATRNTIEPSIREKYATI